MGFIISKLLYMPPTPTYDLTTFPYHLAFIPFNKSIPISQTTATHIPILFFHKPGAKRLIIYSHGNASDLGAIFAESCYLSHYLDAHLICIEYPGYGIYPGTPCEQNTVATLHTVVEYVKNEMQVDLNYVFLYGRSLGTGVSAQVAALLTLKYPNKINDELNQYDLDEENNIQIPASFLQSQQPSITHNSPLIQAQTQDALRSPPEDGVEQYNNGQMNRNSLNNTNNTNKTKLSIDINTTTNSQSSSTLTNSTHNQSQLNITNTNQTQSNSTPNSTNTHTTHPNTDPSSTTTQPIQIDTNSNSKSTSTTQQQTTSNDNDNNNDNDFYSIPEPPPDYKNQAASSENSIDMSLGPKSLILQNLTQNGNQNGTNPYNSTTQKYTTRTNTAVQTEQIGKIGQLNTIQQQSQQPQQQHQLQPSPLSQHPSNTSQTSNTSQNGNNSLFNHHGGPHMPSNSKIHKLLNIDPNKTLDEQTPRSKQRGMFFGSPSHNNNQNQSTMSSTTTIQNGIVISTTTSTTSTTPRSTPSSSGQHDIFIPVLNQSQSHFSTNNNHQQSQQQSHSSNNNTTQQPQPSPRSQSSTPRHGPQNDENGTNKTNSVQFTSIDELTVTPPQSQQPSSQSTNSNELDTNTSMNRSENPPNQQFATHLIEDVVVEDVDWDFYMLDEQTTRTRGQIVSHTTPTSINQQQQQQSTPIDTFLHSSPSSNSSTILQSSSSSLSPQRHQSNVHHNLSQNQHQHQNSNYNNNSKNGLFIKPAPLNNKITQKFGPQQKLTKIRTNRSITPLAGLILHSPFSSINDVVKSATYSSFLLKDHFRTKDVIGDISCPTLFIHGMKDKLIPYSHSQLLMSLSSGVKKRLYLAPTADHNSFSYKVEVIEPIERFIRQYCTIVQSELISKEIIVTEGLEKFLTDDGDGRNNNNNNNNGNGNRINGDNNNKLNNTSSPTSSQQSPQPDPPPQLLTSTLSPIPTPTSPTKPKKSKDENISDLMKNAKQDDNMQGLDLNLTSTELLVPAPIHLNGAITNINNTINNNSTSSQTTTNTTPNRKSSRKSVRTDRHRTTHGRNMNDTTQTGQNGLITPSTNNNSTSNTTKPSFNKAKMARMFKKPDQMAKSKGIGTVSVTTINTITTTTISCEQLHIYVPYGLFEPPQSILKYTIQLQLLHSNYPNDVYRFYCAPYQTFIDKIIIYNATHLPNQNGRIKDNELPLTSTHYYRTNIDRLNILNISGTPQQQSTSQTPTNTMIHNNSGSRTSVLTSPTNTSSSYGYIGTAIAKQHFTKRYDDLLSEQIAIKEAIVHLRENRDKLIQKALKEKEQLDKVQLLQQQQVQLQLHQQNKDKNGHIGQNGDVENENNSGDNDDNDVPPPPPLDDNDSIESTQKQQQQQPNQNEATTTKIQPHKLTVINATNSIFAPRNGLDSATTSNGTNDEDNDDNGDIFIDTNTTTTPIVVDNDDFFSDFNLSTVPKTRRGGFSISTTNTNQTTGSISSSTNQQSNNAITTPTSPTSSTTTPILLKTMSLPNDDVVLVSNNNNNNNEQSTISTKSIHNDTHSASSSNLSIQSTQQSKQHSTPTKSHPNQQQQRQQQQQQHHQQQRSQLEQQQSAQTSQSGRWGNFWTKITSYGATPSPSMTQQPSQQQQLQPHNQNIDSTQQHKPHQKLKQQQQPQSSGQYKAYNASITQRQKMQQSQRKKLQKQFRHSTYIDEARTIQLMREHDALNQDDDDDDFRLPGYFDIEDENLYTNTATITSTGKNDHNIINNNNNNNQHHHLRKQRRKIKKHSTPMNSKNSGSSGSNLQHSNIPTRQAAISIAVTKSPTPRSSVTISNNNSPQYSQNSKSNYSKSQSKSTSSKSTTTKTIDEQGTTTIDLNGFCSDDDGKQDYHNNNYNNDHKDPNLDSDWDSYHDSNSNNDEDNEPYQWSSSSSESDPNINATHKSRLYSRNISSQNNNIGNNNNNDDMNDMDINFEQGEGEDGDYYNYYGESDEDDYYDEDEDYEYYDVYTDDDDSDEIDYGDVDIYNANNKNVLPLSLQPTSIQNSLLASQQQQPQMNKVSSIITTTTTMTTTMNYDDDNGHIDGDNNDDEDDSGYFDDDHSDEDSQ